MGRTILIVDDDWSQREYLEAVITGLGYRAQTLSGGAEAIQLLCGDGNHDVDLVLLDLVMPGVDGIDVLRKVVPENPGLPVVVLTVQAGVDTVVEVMRAGALDYIIKPVSPDRLEVSIDNALKLATLTGEVSRLARRAANTMDLEDLVAETPAMRRTLELAQRAAASNIPILIEGNSGVGKEVVAHVIQGSGARAGKPFVIVNCGAIPDNLVESILFGHEKGSFTGATERRAGKFLEANGGTLFLDEIGELKPEVQVKLLRVLQSGEIDPVGSGKPQKVDVRVISATNQELAMLVSEGRFREDLYYRLNVFPIVVPTLRDRRDDIQPLAERFLRTYAATEGKPIKGITPDAMDMMQAYRWPGNVRELENAVFRAVVLCDSANLGVQDFPNIAGRSFAGDGNAGGARRGVTATAPGDPTDVAVRDAQGDVRPLNEVESDIIRAALSHYDGRMAEVARRLGIGRSTLYRKVRELGIEVEADRSGDSPLV
ncbi:MAG: sigma-54-dependent Fis family transcriptional regulator [Alphaproteobacteria bacterium]|nr:sigma-54-dependent Fis family transcriptional regulator [Alphaproteobacteria bacterium]